MRELQPRFVCPTHPHSGQLVLPSASRLGVGQGERQEGYAQGTAYLKVASAEVDPGRVQAGASVRLNTVAARDKRRAPPIAKASADEVDLGKVRARTGQVFG